MSTLLIMVALWVTIGAVNFAATFAFFQRNPRWSLLDPIDWERADQRIALWIGLTGPIGLVVTVVVIGNPFRYGLKWRRSCF